MRLALVQQTCSSDKEQNVQKGLENMRRAADEGANIVCFSELAFEPFYPQKPASGDLVCLAETVPGPTTERFQLLANELGMVTVINLFEQDGDRFYDCSPVIGGDGALLGKTRMAHITDFDRFHEKSYYAPGDTGAPVYTTKYGRIGVAICYDRHFPEYMRSLALKGAELVLIPQAGALDEWPEGLYEAEVRVAAFQNGYFAALCNRVGEEELLTFGGESFVCSPEGQVLARAARATEDLLVVDLDLGAVPRSPARQLFLPDRRPDLYAELSARHPGGGEDTTPHPGG